jgi:hypothetical protein
MVPPEHLPATMDELNLEIKKNEGGWNHWNEMERFE